MWMGLYRGLARYDGEKNIVLPDRRLTCCSGDPGDTGGPSRQYLAGTKIVDCWRSMMGRNTFGMILRMDCRHNV